MEKMGTAEPNFEQLFEEKKRARNPLVPIGALVTAGVLTAGLISFRRGNSQLGQVLMRARVVVQGATVALMVGTAFYYGDNPWKKPKLAHDEILRSVNMDVVRILVQVLKEGITSSSDE